MVEQLRLKERLHETFGKDIDPRVVEGPVDQKVLATEGQRRVAVLFCDISDLLVPARMTLQARPS
jgi:adenylate cyclase